MIMTTSMPAGETKHGPARSRLAQPIAQQDNPRGSNHRSEAERQVLKMTDVAA